MPSIIQADQLKSADGVTTYLNNGTLSNLTFPDSIYIAGTGAFMARFNSSAWITVADGAILEFNDDSTGDSYDTDGNFNTGTYKYEVPATGVYYFFYAIYTAYDDTGNGFGFTTNNGEIANQNHSAYYGTYMEGAEDNTQTCSHILNLTSGDTVWVSARTSSDVYPGHSYWGGCRLK